MHLERPDLGQIDPAVRTYIEALEAEVERLRGQGERPTLPPLEPSEPPTTLNVITVSLSGFAKRTPRHLYGRQRRGGMGIFDLDAPEDDPPTWLTIADENQKLLLFTTLARVFELPVNALSESPVRARGEALSGKLPLERGECLALVLPDAGGTYLAVLGQRGFVRSMARAYLRPGVALFDAQAYGPPVSACWTTGKSELFIATCQGRAIRFPERGLPVSGGPGIRLERDDAAVALAAVEENSGVFLLGADGMGAVRLMAGFSANKAPGAGGKIALKTDRLVGAVGVSEADDLFIISRLSKIIRFKATEVPSKEGVVQGVHCIALRADEAAAMTSGRPIAV